jgi:uncharacterized protein
MYNTILGAKPLLADGHTFYYSDCNFDGHKVYSKNRWPCCSGTFPQIAADYRISTYFRDAEDIYVNLYLPSTLRWTQGSVQASLTQKTSYPFDSLVQLDLKLSKPAPFTLYLRIPVWAEGAAIFLNGQKYFTSTVPGTFASLEREWKSGDRIELNLPLTMRIEPINDKHRDTVALLSGPLVLFAVSESAPVITRSQLLSARQVAANRWQAQTASAPLTLLPFTAIDEQRYSTYLNVS